MINSAKQSIRPQGRLDCLAALAMTKIKKIGGNKHVPIRKTRRSGFSPCRRAQGVEFPRRGSYDTGAWRGPGSAAHHLAVARSLYARTHERRPVLCGAGADRRRDG